MIRRQTNEIPEDSIKVAPEEDSLLNVHYENDRTNTVDKFTGEKDLSDLPLTQNVLDWHHFNVNLWSTQRKMKDVSTICSQFSQKLVDLRPYMIEEPYVVHITDKLPKVLSMFRHFHLRALPVIDPNDGSPVACITRSNLFAYMDL